MDTLNPDNNNFFFDTTAKCNLTKEKIIFDQQTHRTSISTNETYENEFDSEDEIDFNQDFFPKPKLIKFTDCLVDDWEEKIKDFRDEVVKSYINMIKKI